MNNLYTSHTLKSSSLPPFLSPSLLSFLPFSLLLIFTEDYLCVRPGPRCLRDSGKQIDMMPETGHSRPALVCGLCDTCPGVTPLGIFLPDFWLCFLWSFLSSLSASDSYMDEEKRVYPQCQQAKTLKLNFTLSCLKNFGVTFHPPKLYIQKIQTILRIHYTYFQYSEFDGLFSHFYL